jgi:hypothetical protein
MGIDKKKVIYLGFWVIIAILVILKLLNIFNNKIDVDEALLLIQSNVDSDFIDIVIRLTPDPPLMWYIANTITHFFPNISLYILRVFSFLSFIMIALLILIYFKNFIEINLLKVILLLISLNPLIWFYSVFAKPYIFELLISTLLIIVVHKIIDDFNEAYIFIFSLLTVILFYYSYHTIYFIISLFIGQLFILYDKDKTIKFIITRYLFSVFIFILAILPWTGVFLNQFQQVKMCWAAKISDIFKFSFWGTLQDLLFFVCNGNWFFWPKIILITLSLFTLPLLIYSLYSIVRDHNNKFTCFLIIIAVFPLVISFILNLFQKSSVYYPRMYLTSLLPILIIIGYAISKMIKIKAGKVYIGIILLLMAFSSILQLFGKHPVKAKNISEIIKIAKENSTTDTQILVHPPIMAYLLAAHDFKNYYTICTDISNQQSSTCSSFISPDEKCYEFLKDISRKYDKLLLINNKSVSDLMVDKENILQLYLKVLSYENTLLYKDSQYEVILFLRQK